MPKVPVFQLYSRLRLLKSLLEIAPNLRADPFSHGHRNAIPDHSISVVVTPGESETVRHSLQPRILPNRIRPHATLKPPVRNQSRTQVFGVVRSGSVILPHSGIEGLDTDTLMRLCFCNSGHTRYFQLSCDGLAEFLEL
jgi:hypothetical protein